MKGDWGGRKRADLTAQKGGAANQSYNKSRTTKRGLGKLLIKCLNTFDVIDTPCV